MIVTVRCYAAQTECFCCFSGSGGDSRQPQTFSIGFNNVCIGKDLAQDSANLAGSPEILGWKYKHGSKSVVLKTRELIGKLPAAYGLCLLGALNGVNGINWHMK